MNERFAAEPTTCDTLADVRLLLDKFGPATGRYLATYPRRWEDHVADHIRGWNDVERQAAMTRMRRAREARALVRVSNVAYDDRVTWLENAEKVQAVAAPFAGVVVSRSSAGKYPAIDELELPPTAARRVLANAAEYERAARVLLSESPELHFIDPYLDPCDAARRIVLEHMLATAAKGKCEGAYLWVRADRLKASVPESLNTLRRLALQVGFRGSIGLRVFTDAGADVKVHDRYLLTLYGAIRFEHGFQQLHGRRTASVAPESEASHIELMRTFMEGQNDLLIEVADVHRDR